MNTVITLHCKMYWHFPYGVARSRLEQPRQRRAPQKKGQRHFRNRPTFFNADAHLQAFDIASKALDEVRA